MAGSARTSVMLALCILAAPAHAAVLRGAPQAPHAFQAHLEKKSFDAPGPGPAFRNSSLLFSVPIPVTLVAEAPQMFVAVLTTRATPIAKRTAIRQLWKEVDGGQGHICSRFVVCQGADSHQNNLVAEQSAYGDMLFLPCAEGYAQGLLTKKVIEAMRAYRLAAGGKDLCLDRPMFMKMDDDTFVSGHRFRQGLSAAVKQFGSEFMYAGVDLPAQPPDRNASSPWYEPFQVWPHQNYAPAMYGGPGYILGRGLVHRIIDRKVADSHILWNEDRAVGAWVNMLEQGMTKVNWVRIPGTNGFEWDHPVMGGTWGAYPYTLHHHLSRACITCLTAVDQANQWYTPLEACFAKDPLGGEAIGH